MAAKIRIDPKQAVRGLGAGALVVLTRVSDRAGPSACVRATGLLRGKGRS